MASTIDPITGAPNLTAPLAIDQIPLSAQPVPYDDQTTQPTAGRQLYYPDDVPPTMANINAMNSKDPSRAQTVHTDGNHRLLVRLDPDQVSSGGGGGGASGISPNWAPSVNSFIDYGGAQDYAFNGPDSPASLLYSVQIAAVLDPTVGGNAPSLGYAFAHFWIGFSGDHEVFGLGTIAACWNGVDGGSSTCGQLQIVYPNGLTWDDMAIPADSIPRLYYDLENGPWRISATWAWKQ